MDETQTGQASIIDRAERQLADGCACDGASDCRVCELLIVVRKLIEYGEALSGHWSATADAHRKTHARIAELERELAEARLDKARVQAAKAVLVTKLSILAREGDHRVKGWLSDADAAARKVRPEDLVRANLNTAARGEGEGEN